MLERTGRRRRSRSRREGSICRSKMKVACRHPLSQPRLAGYRQYVTRRAPVRVSVSRAKGEGKSNMTQQRDHPFSALVCSLSSGIAAHPLCPGTAPLRGDRDAQRFSIGSPQRLRTLAKKAGCPVVSFHGLCGWSQKIFENLMPMIPASGYLQQWSRYAGSLEPAPNVR